MKKLLLQFVFLGIFSLTISSCTTLNTNSTKSDLSGKWQVDYIMTNDGKTLEENYPLGVPYINFIANNLINASDGCNTLNGSITLTDKEITFGNLITTMRGCEGVNDFAFNSKLKGKLKYSLNGDKLTFIQDDIVVMRFKRPGNLDGTWVLEEFIPVDKSSKSLDQRFPNHKPMLTFQNNKLSGNNGCNNLNGGYVAIGKTLKIGKVATTMMACTGVDEVSFNNRLNAVNSYDIQNDKLVLYVDGVKAMTFGIRK